MKNINHLPKYAYLAISALAMVCVSIIIIIFSESNKQYSNSPITKDGFYFDTYISITVYDCEENNEISSKTTEDFNRILGECLNICDKYQSILDPNDENSQLYQLNSNEDYRNGHVVKISEELAHVIQKTIEYSKPFKDKFTIFSGDLCALWDYNSKKIPTEVQIEYAVNNIKSHSFTLTDNTLQTNADTNTSPGITLGASAKGYIADEIGNYLKTQGINEAIIDLGGNVLVLGDKFDDSMYSIGIKKPFSENSDLSAACKVADKSVVTSGIYERYFEQDGEIYHHIIDPTTGYPSDNGILSVTIICDNSLIADCYSTGCFLYPVDYILNTINTSEDDIECIIIDEAYNIILSDGLTYDGDFIVLK